jgi:hypothetical protein
MADRKRKKGRTEGRERKGKDENGRRGKKGGRKEGRK